MAQLRSVVDFTVSTSLCAGRITPSSDDRPFQAYAITDIGGVVTALENAGVGFGKLVAIRNKSPQ
ncbi:MAG TPA: hypothetical protein VJ741_06305 [Solirubrobacteraceae bacterium]|nr:hypothetical protein [Solirubrobacteraceae bacterium]